MHVRSLLRVTMSVALAVIALSAILLWLENPRAQAQPLFTARTYPGCGTTLQDCINSSSDGDLINIQAGTYITSVTLSKAVSLVGAGASSTTLSALANQRVITVTGAGITNSTVISGLTIANGNASANGGGMQVTG
ncbi:MAG: hypothetical protein LC737_11175, partial [Chloroflexi bacterium]|nr:hypothetical protein [Chloroflexota bacterium]